MKLSSKAERQGQAAGAARYTVEAWKTFMAAPVSFSLWFDET